VLDGRLAPRRGVPLGREPVAYVLLGLSAILAHVDGELIRGREGRGIAAGFLREGLHLLPSLGEALRGVEVGEPPIALRARALEQGVDVAADEDGRARALRGAGDHDRLAQVELVDLDRGALLRPETHQDVEVALEDAPALLEGDAHRVEFARVPA